MGEAENISDSGLSDAIDDFVLAINRVRKKNRHREILTECDFGLRRGSMENQNLWEFYFTQTFNLE